jgi:hypothetical protein
VAHKHTGKKNVELQLIVALAGGATAEKAAKAAGCSTRTVWRRLKDPAFKARVTKARDQALERALGHLASGAVESAITLRHLLRGCDGKLKLGAAKALLGAGLRVRADFDLTQRVEKLLAALDAHKKQQQQKPVVTHLENDHAICDGNAPQGQGA